MSECNHETGECRTISMGGGITWVPYHTWCDGTDQIDARLVDATGRDIPGGCDLICTADNHVTDHDRSLAAALWDTGTVHVGDEAHYGAVTLIVPSDELTEDLVETALRRFTP